MLIEQHLPGLAAVRWLWFHPPVFLMLSPGVPPPPAARGGVSHRTRRSFCRIRFELTPRGLRLKNTHFESTKTTETSPAVCRVSPGSGTDLQVSREPGCRADSGVFSARSVPEPP
ncbi:hypothetical protein KUCAC02_037478 [Chaenocephalus aceratus]|nr:hypothetical protein KUCAC02_037478 [Chaenocephalus aceratus]